MIELKLNDDVSVEIEERRYDEEVYINRAWLVRNGKERRLIDTHKLEFALIRRFGYDWRLEANYV